MVHRGLYMCQGHMCRSAAPSANSGPVVRYVKHELYACCVYRWGLTAQVNTAQACARSRVAGIEPIHGIFDKLMNLSRQLQMTSSHSYRPTNWNFPIPVDFARYCDDKAYARWYHDRVQRLITYYTLVYEGLGCVSPYIPQWSIGHTNQYIQGAGIYRHIWHVGKLACLWCANLVGVNETWVNKMAIYSRANC